mmetsp:Transcript_23736/g.74247  ORF Transcript_23736/g.74247 Transcript_23736/m.74247 type:complete len:247 (+) Transcript_23736:140-880(+)
MTGQAAVTARAHRFAAGVGRHGSRGGSPAPAAATLSSRASPFAASRSVVVLGSRQRGQRAGIVATSCDVDWNAAMEKLERVSRKMGPRLDLDAEGCLREQLDALHESSTEEVDGLAIQPWRQMPHLHRGIEMCWKFAKIDIFAEPPKHQYFGKPFRDLSRFSLFQRGFIQPSHSILIGITSYEVLGQLDLSDHARRFRVRVVNREGARGSQPATERIAVYGITVVQAVGGWKDGCWYTESIVREEE